ncbi:MAG TPA: arsenate reductase (glutaredoxin) [Oxalicibacterium sp.]
MLTIYHNPRCSKSRGALELTTAFAERHGLDLQVVDYQKTPLTRAQLVELHRLLQSEGAVSVRDMVRDGETAFAELQLAEADDDALLNALATHPGLLQRPIVCFNERAVIARPPELVERILQAD